MRALVIYEPLSGLEQLAWAIADEMSVYLVVEVHALNQAPNTLERQGEPADLVVLGLASPQSPDAQRRWAKRIGQWIEGMDIAARRVRSAVFELGSPDVRWTPLSPELEALSPCVGRRSFWLDPAGEVSRHECSRAAHWGAELAKSMALSSAVDGSAGPL